MVEELLSAKYLLLALFVASAVYVQLRGRVRLRFGRQLTDHSTIMAPYNVLMYAFSRVPTRKPYIDVAQFPELRPLQDNWRIIAEEAARLLDEGHIKAAAKYNDLGFNSFFRTGWKRFYLKWYEAPLPSAEAMCPRTVALLKSIPSVHGAMFAALPPGGRLNAHRDPFAGSLRYHLGLVCPNDDRCFILVDGERYSWRDGQAVMFDETFVHYAENGAGTTRIVLFCDVERPLATRVMTAINRFVCHRWMKASTTQNVEGERVGLANRIFGFVYQIRIAAKAFKKRSRRGYYAAKYSAMAVVFAAIFVWPLIRHFG
jgi:beta-hydroxylase